MAYDTQELSEGNRSRESDKEMCITVSRRLYCSPSWNSVRFSNPATFGNPIPDLNLYSNVHETFGSAIVKSNVDLTLNRKGKS